MSGGLLEVQRAQPWLGTLVSIRVTALSPTTAHQLQAFVDAAFGEIARVHHCMSYHAADSTLTRVNLCAASRAVQTDPDTHAVLRSALEFAAASEGAFDPTVAGQLEDWGYLPRPAQSPPAQRGDWRAVELDAQGRVRFHRALRLDLGGIAKGYAVDRASDVLAHPAINGFLVNAGGDLRVGGAEAQTILLRDPRSPTSVVRPLVVQEKAVATSGSYYSARRLEQGDVSHLVDTRRALPFLEHEQSVTVSAPRCIDADALTKVVLFAEPAVAQTLLKRCSAQAFVLRAAAAA